MPAAELSYYLERFEQYTKRFQQDTPKKQKIIDFKREHSLLVLEEAKAITTGLTLPPRMTFLVHLSALYHDLGRFEQFDRYQIILDAKSVNHARLSVKILRREGMLRKIGPKERALVHAAILLHNPCKLPPNLNSKLRKLAGILRDADKLANMPAVLDLFDPDTPTDNYLTLDLDPDPEAYTPEIFVNVESGQIVDYRDLRWMNDLKLGALGWANDLNYPYTCGQFLQRGYVDRLLLYCPQRTVFSSLGKKIKEKLEYSQRGSTLAY